MEVEPNRSAVYFDGSCPLCRAEIGYYRRKDRSGALCFIDVSEPDALIPVGLTRRRAMERFHVRNGNGSLVSGAAAFVELWTRLPHWHWAARAAALPGILAILELGYRLFLPARPVLATIFEGIRRLKGMNLSWKTLTATDAHQDHEIPRTLIVSERPQKEFTNETSQDPQRSELQH